MQDENKLITDDMRCWRGDRAKNLKLGSHLGRALVTDQHFIFLSTGGPKIFRLTGFVVAVLLSLVTVSLFILPHTRSFLGSAGLWMLLIFQLAVLLMTYRHRKERTAGLEYPHDVASVGSLVIPLIDIEQCFTYRRWDGTACMTIQYRLDGKGRSVSFVHEFNFISFDTLNSIKEAVLANMEIQLQQGGEAAEAQN